MHVNIFNLKSGVNDTKFLVRHQSCECKYRLNKSIGNSKQKWNHDECRYECKELDDSDTCKNDYIRNPNTCDCEFKKACKVD